MRRSILAGIPALRECRGEFRPIGVGMTANSANANAAPLNVHRYCFACDDKPDHAFLITCFNSSFTRDSSHLKR